MAFPSILAAKTGAAASPNSRLNVAFVGVGGKGRSAVLGMKAENLVAFCDVDQRRVDDGRADNAEFDAVLKESEANGARWFTDYRDMLTDMKGKIDAVVISTPDHMHYPIALSAINLGMHVYCEKPLTHTV